MVASTFLLSIEFNSDSFGLRTIIIKENYNVPAHAGEHRKCIDRRPIAPCRFFIYVASLLNRHGISCNPCHAVKARHCLVCHAAPRVMVPDPLGRGQKWILGRNTPLLCVIVTVNTTLSGGGQPPLAAQVHKACWDYVACDRFAYPLVKENSISHSQQIPAFRLWNRIFRTPSDIGTCSECRISAAGYLPRRRKITS